MSGGTTSFTIPTPTFTPLYESAGQAISGVSPAGAYPSGFDPAMASLLGQVCVLTYMQYGDPGAPIDLSDLPLATGVSSYSQLGSSPLTWTESIGTGTAATGQPATLTTVLPGSAGFTTIPFGFAFSALDSDNNPVFNVIAFRGTRSYSEWISDASAIPTVNKVASGPDFLLPALVHGGFYQLYSPTVNVPTEGTLASQVYAILDLIQSGMEKTKTKPVPLYITGHSLGAALAELCAADLGNNYADGYFSALYEYSLASPQVAAGISTNIHYDPLNKSKVLAISTAQFTQEVFGNYVTGAYRVVNAADLVPVLPSNLGSPGGWQIEFVPTISTENTLYFLVQTGDVLANHDCLLYAGFLNQLPATWVPSTEETTT